MSAAEQWVPIPGYEGRYDVSDQGNVRSWVIYRGQPGPRILKGHPDRCGYLRVVLSPQGHVAIHSLVLLTFVGPRPPGLETRHLDGDPANNHLTNLTYGTHSENVQDCIRHGTTRGATTTHCPRGHPYDEANTYNHPGRGRECRQCRAEASRIFKARRRAAVPR